MNRCRSRRWAAAAISMLCTASGGCSSDDATGAASGVGGTGGTAEPTAGPSGGGHGGGGYGGGAGVAGAAPIEETGPPWDPGTRLGSAPGRTRGLVDVRGLIHEHSVYSHDACDGAPRDANGNIDEQCFQDFHDGMCGARHDFVMLTDHSTFFSETEYPETLLYRAGRGDTLVEHQGVTTANRVPCDGAAAYLVMAGTESGAMPVGLEGHVGDAAARAIYGDLSPEAIEALKAAGAVVLVAHTETFTPEQLVDLPLDGFEMYNLHANLFLDLAKVGDIALLLDDATRLLHPDLLVGAVLTEDPVYLSTWGTVLARGARRVTTMGTDAHRNALNIPTPDGERVDSYRRLNLSFANHLLVEPASDGAWDDRSLKDALRAGRLYGVFELFGYAADFSFVATVAGERFEMGTSHSVADGVTLEVMVPRVRLLDPDVEPPELTARLLRAVEGGWEVMGEGSDDLAVEVSLAGAYRAEIRMRPKHLRPFLNDFSNLADENFVWIYSNAIYVND